MNTSSVFIIQVLHIILIALAILVPFVGNTMLRSMYFISIPFLLVHWITNNDICVLSIIERTVRGLDNSDDCFMCNLLSPIFKINHLSMSAVMYVVTITLWIFNGYKLWHDKLLWKMISDIKHIIRDWNSKDNIVKQ